MYIIRLTNLRLVQCGSKCQTESPCQSGGHCSHPSQPSSAGGRSGSSLRSNTPVKYGDPRQSQRNPLSAQVRHRPSCEKKRWKEVGLVRAEQGKSELSATNLLVKLLLSRGQLLLYGLGLNECPEPIFLGKAAPQRHVNSRPSFRETHVDEEVLVNGIRQIPAHGMIAAVNTGPSRGSQSQHPPSPFLGRASHPSSCQQSMPERRARTWRTRLAWPLYSAC